MTDPIASPANERIKRLVRLRSRRERDRTGLFLIEGYRELRRALDAGLALEELYSCPELYLGDGEAAVEMEAAAGGAELIPTAAGPFRKASYRDRPEGLLGVARQFDVSLERLSPPADAMVLVVEGIEKPGNLGTMLRTASAAGAAAVVVAGPRTDPFNPNVVRASLGSLFAIPLAVGSTGDVVTRLNELSLRLIAATPDAALTHSDADLTGAVALAVGSEQYGLSSQMLAAAAERVVIPMPGGDVDSLNAAMAAGVLLFEAVRQRG